MTTRLQDMRGLRARWTKTDLIVHLHALEQALGRPVRTRDIAAAGRLGGPGIKAYRNAFGAVSSAVDILHRAGAR